MWNITSGAKIFSIAAHSNAIYGIQILNNYTFASASNDKTIKIWNATNGDNILSMRNSYEVFSLTVLTNGSLASGDGAGIFEVKIWNSQNGLKINALAGHTASINSLELVNANTLASGGADGTIILWNLSNGNKIRTLTSNGVVIWYLKRVTYDSVAAGCNNFNIYIWNITTGSIRKTLANHTLDVESLDLLNDFMLVSVSIDFKVNIWNVLSGNLLKTFTNDAAIYSLRTLRNGKLKCIFTIIKCD